MRVSNVGAVHGFFKGLTRKDFIILSFLFILAILVKLPAWNYTIIGDATLYTELTESIGTNFSYHAPIYDSGRVPHGTVPPLFPLLSSLFLFLGGGVYAIKFAAILFSSLTVVLGYVFLRSLKFHKMLSTLGALFIMFNPWFFYFDGILPLTESLANFLLLLGIFFFYLRRSKTTYFLSGLFFGLAMVTRFLVGSLVAFFGFYCLYEIFKKKDIIKNLIFLSATAILPVLWFLRNIIVFGGLFSEGSGYTAVTSMWVHIPYMLGTYLFVFLLTFTVLIPLILIHAYGVWKKKDHFWLVVLFACMVSFIGTFIVTYNPAPWLMMAISRTRYLTPLIPILTISAFIAFRGLKWPKMWKKLLLVVCLIGFILISFFISYGFVKDEVDRFFPTPSFLTQRAYHRAQAIGWINMNSESSVTIIELQDNEQGMNVQNIFFDPFFMNDNKVAMSSDYLEADYLISDKTIFSDDYPGLVEVYRSTGAPYVYVYRFDPGE